MKENVDLIKEMNDLQREKKNMQDDELNRRKIRMDRRNELIQQGVVLGGGGGKNVTQLRS